MLGLFTTILNPWRMFCPWLRLLKIIALFSIVAKKMLLLCIVALEQCALYTVLPAYTTLMLPHTHTQETLLVNTERDNKSLFTTRELRQTEKAKQLYALVGRLNHETFLDMIRHNRLRNCPINVEDANRAIQGYGPDIA